MMPARSPLDMSNLRAFLDMIAVSELGEQLIALSDNGYNVLVGSTPSRPRLFASYADHPRVLVDLGRGVKSTAAGRYQVLQRYFDSYRVKLSLLDFSPESQDRIAVQMIREQGAYQYVQSGQVEIAIAKVANIWASLPGAGYGQHEHQLAYLRQMYLNAGGVAA